jgi:predicted alpha-1,2-mannosidase
MNGDPSAPAIADIYAFGGRDFDAKAAYALLLKAATVPTEKDASHHGCEVQCIGERPGLAEWLKLHYMPLQAPGWGAGADTLEMTSADFGLSQLAGYLGDTANAQMLRARSGWWRNIYNPAATPDEGYIQPRNEDGSWPKFDPASDDGFVEGSGAVYLWMVPYDPQGLFEMMGGNAKAAARLDRFFYNPDGSLAVTKAGELHAELNNEPSIAAPWLYDFAGEPWKTQSLVRATVNSIWTNAPDGIPGNDDLGEMSSWYVWAGLGMYPLYPGRSEFVLGSPLFSQIDVERPGGRIVIRAGGAAPDAPYIASLRVDGVARAQAWLPASFATKGGTLDFTLSKTPDKKWGAATPPPSFGPRAGENP